MKKSVEQLRQDVQHLRLAIDRGGLPSSTLAILQAKLRDAEAAINRAVAVEAARDGCP